MARKVLSYQEAADIRGTRWESIRTQVYNGRLDAAWTTDGQPGVYADQVASLRPNKNSRAAAARLAAGRSATPPRAHRAADAPYDEAERHKPLRISFTPDEVRILSYALYFALLSGRLRGAEPQVTRDLMVRFSSALDPRGGWRRRFLAAARGRDMPERPRTTHTPPVTLAA